jgi:hypothetical protein
MKSRRFKKTLMITSLIILLIVIFTYLSWSHLINFMMPADSRPGRVSYPAEKVTSEEFDQIAAKLQQQYDLDFDHIERFRENHILTYEGPQTCLTCHQEIEVEDHATNEVKNVDLMNNLLSSAHYKFFTTKHPNVYGFNGELADNFPMGKIDRPCPKPGSFAMTAWAEIVVTEKGDTLSEGCGQCHIGGQYQAPLGDMMPRYKTLAVEKETIDCLICHSAAYDMNRKVVVNDENGNRWAQDRSMKAAMSVTNTTSQTCLRCHQHNFGGDIYVDEADSSYMQSLTNTGYDRPRVLHPGSKRGTPFSPTWDVHAAAGLNCTDCHVTEGHLIAKGTHTTTMMANDLPDIEITCETCHSGEPHSENEELADYLNVHIEKIACTTCHIPSLHPDNATMRDFANPVFEEDPGIYVYHDIKKETAPGKGIGYVWWNGDATFLGNPIGDNPNGENLYRFYKPAYVWPEFKDFDYTAWYENVMRPIANKKPSKLYALKYFNGQQHIDLQNIGPFGGMFVPYNLPTYYRTGDPDSAARKEMEKSMMKMMYGFMFDKYLMDKFLTFMDVDGWNTEAYDEVVAGEKVEPRWLPNDAMLEISHAIRREGALTCSNCHAQQGALDWQALGYTDSEIENLTQNPLE